MRTLDKSCSSPPSTKAELYAAHDLQKFPQPQRRNIPNTPPPPTVLQNEGLGGNFCVVRMCHENSLRANFHKVRC